MMDLINRKPPEKIKLVEINPHLTCYLCKGYYVDATTISECLHSFCRSCIIKFLHKHSYCPICEVIINKAKPNLKLDKTLQDIVYKLVPELFLNEMKRRQRFYQSHPDLAAKVTPEERGEDTERTIFNPRDTISLSIEYISDDSTPGAILIPQLIVKGVDSNNKNSSNEVAADNNEENSAIRRFLQCPGMCRIEVLKKFIRNKYNVDTNQYYIDILYKRVPLPDHYTLIDIAYIYSWKRNEPMKFFFKITDINFVTDNFDYLIRPQQEKIVKSVNASKTKSETTHNSPKTIKKDKSPDKIKNAAKEKTKNKEKRIETDSDENMKKHQLDRNVVINENEELSLENLKKNTRNKEYTNITLDRSNNVEIITKIQKVSNKNGLQIGIKITKQTVKKPPSFEQNGIKSIKKDDSIKDVIKGSPVKERPLKLPKPQTPPQTPQVVLPEIDQEKSNFLRSIELTAKNVIQAMTPRKVDCLKPTESPPPPPPPLSPHSSSSGKRKNPSPVKTEKPPKRPRKYVSIQPKPNIQNPAVWQMLSNVSQNVTSVSKIVEQMTPATTSTANSGSNSDLQALLFDSYKINIPSSLSVTVKNEKDAPTPSALQKPVQNYIEILKLPESPATSPVQIQKDQTKSNPTECKPKLEIKVEDASTPETTATPPKQLKIEPLDVENIKEETVQEQTNKSSLPTSTKSAQTPPGQTKVSSGLPSPPYVPTNVKNVTSRETFVKLNPRTPQTFQKMFEEAIKKPEFSSKFQTVPIAKSDSNPTSKSHQKSALNLTTSAASETPTSGGKRNIMEIASKLYKKTKMEQEKVNVTNEAVASKEESKPTLNVPRLSQPKKPKSFESKGNPPLKDFASYISSKSTQSKSHQTVTSLHSPSLGLNYTVSVTQANVPNPKKPSTTNKDQGMTQKSPVRPPAASPKSESGNRKSPKTSPVPPKSPAVSPSKKSASPTRKLPSPTVTKASPNGISSGTQPTTDKNQPLNPDQILEKYNIQNLAQLTANFNFSPHLCMGPAANQLAAIHQAMIYRHFEMQNHQNWLNMNPGPLVQYEKYLQSLSKSS